MESVFVGPASFDNVAARYLRQISGTCDAIFFIWLAVISPALEIPYWHWKWKRLERFRHFVIKRHDNELLEQIDEELEWVRDWNTPTTVGAIKSLMGKYERDNYRRMNEIGKGIAKLKKS